jgi:uncharacterized membrane protein YhaH (DUF805 family)
MTFMEAVRSGFSNYVTFSGRARRSEFWFWTLFAIIISVVAMLVDGMIFPDLMTAQVTDAGASFQSQGGPISLVVSLGLILPGLAMAVRRLHDTDRSGWWLLIGLIPLIGLIVLIVWYVTEGTKGPNRFGADPKA